MMSPAKDLNIGSIFQVCAWAFDLLSTQNAIFGIDKAHTILQHHLKWFSKNSLFSDPPGPKTKIFENLKSKNLEKIDFQNFRKSRNFQKFQKISKIWLIKKTYFLMILFLWCLEVSEWCWRRPKRILKVRPLNIGRISLSSVSILLADLITCWNICQKLFKITGKILWKLKSSKNKV